MKLRLLLREKKKRKIDKSGVKWVRHFIEAYHKIVDTDANLIKFKLNKTQRHIMDVIEELWENNIPVRVIILKARQEGVSTLVQGIGNALTTQLKNFKSKVVSYSSESAQDLFDIGERMYRYLPSHLKPKTKYYTKKSLLFQDSDDPKKSLDSRIVVDTAKNLYSGRSQTIQFLHISEMAMMEHVKSLMLSLMNAVSEGPKSFTAVESTARGVDSYFKEMWDEASTLEEVLAGKTTSQGKTAYVKIFIPWFWHEKYQMEVPEDFKLEADETGPYGNEVEEKKRYGLSMEQMVWRRWAIINKCGRDLDQFKQEYPSNEIEAFRAAGRLRFNKHAIVYYSRHIKKPKYKGNLIEIESAEEAEEHYGDFAPDLLFEDDPYGILKVWEKPKEDVEYMIGADVAEGKLVDPSDERKADWSVASVFKRDEWRKVAELRCRLEPDMFANELFKLGHWYNYCWLVVERNKDGAAVLRSLQPRYAMLYYRKILDQKTEKTTREFGFITDVTTKPIMISDLAMVIREKLQINPSEIAVKEYGDYIIDNKGKTHARSGSYDDVIMSEALCLQGHKLLPMSNEKDKIFAPAKFGYKRRAIS